MRRLGEASSFSEDSGLIVDAEFAPNAGAKIVDKSMDRVGSVDDVFGSVERPFVAVKGEAADEDLIGQSLYVL